MDQAAVVKGRLDAGAAFLREFERHVPVAVAFWLKDAEDGRWRLYAASDRFTAENLTTAYREATRISSDLAFPDSRPAQVILIGFDDPMARDARELFEGRPPRIPFRPTARNFGGAEVEDIYLLKGPTEEYAMPTGREVLDQIIDREASFFKDRGVPPHKIKLPVLMAYDLAKCGRNEMGELSGRVFKDGIAAFETEGFHGMKVEIVRDRDAALELE